MEYGVVLGGIRESVSVNKHKKWGISVLAEFKFHTNT